MDSAWVAARAAAMAAARDAARAAAGAAQLKQFIKMVNEAEPSKPLT
jgi:hypothetical protein